MGKEMKAGFLIAGAGLGAGCMYLMDPDRGRARRARLRDKTGSVCREVRLSVDRVQADLANRAQGLVARAKSVVQPETVDDDQLVARVRAKLGRLVSHPHAIDVIAQQGRITLSGDVLEQEAERLLSGVGAIHGVSSVCDHLLRHRAAGNVSSLQGGPGRALPKPEFLRRDWTPALRMLAGVVGGSLGVYGLVSSKRAVKAVVLPFGIGLLARGITNGREGVRNNENTWRTRGT